MSAANTSSKPGPQLAGAAGSANSPGFPVGSAKCGWIVSQLGDPFCLCNRPATHRDRECGEALCDDHAKDWGEIFGEDSLRSLPPNAPRSATPEVKP